jgi:S-formylglutathione hydrolase FrmB
VIALLAGGAALVAAASAGTLDGVALLDPALAAVVEGLAVLVLAGSWISRRRRWLSRDLAGIVGGGAVLTGVIAAALRLTGTITDPYPAVFALWVGLALAALIGAPVVLAAPGMTRRGLRRCAAGAAVPLTLSGALLLINNEYGVWPTLGDLLGHTRVIDASALHLPPGALRPDHGVLVALDPPATKSHFNHRPGTVYLPPAYFTAARTKLPVIVMLAGAPGGTVQWPTSGRAIATADAYAAGNQGRAPIMLFVDQNGSATGDTECVDGPQGDAETFLTVDVPAFVTKVLHVPHFEGHWAVAGFSAGGTCAIGLALRHPGTYHHFVDLAGDETPNLGDANQSRLSLFGGSAAAQADHDPVRLLRLHQYKGMTAWFAAGVDDHRRIATSRRLAAQALKAGLKVHEFTTAGAHNWQFASAAFAKVLPSLSAELGLHQQAP